MESERGCVSDEASGPASAAETVLASEQWTAGHWAHCSAWTTDSLRVVTKVAPTGERSVATMVPQTVSRWADKMAHWLGQTTASMWAGQ